MTYALQPHLQGCRCSFCLNAANSRYFSLANDVPGIAATPTPAPAPQTIITGIPPVHGTGNAAPRQRSSTTEVEQIENLGHPENSSTVDAKSRRQHRGGRRANIYRRLEQVGFPMVQSHPYGWDLNEEENKHRLYLRACWVQIYSGVKRHTSATGGNWEVARMQLYDFHLSWAMFCHAAQDILDYVYTFLNCVLIDLPHRLGQQLEDGEVTLDVDLEAWVHHQVHDEVSALHDEVFGLGWGLNKLRELWDKKFQPLREYLAKDIPDTLVYLDAPFDSLPTWVPYPHGDESPRLPNMPDWQRPRLELPPVDFFDASFVIMQSETFEGMEFDFSSLM